MPEDMTRIGTGTAVERGWIQNSGEVQLMGVAADDDGMITARPVRHEYLDPDMFTLHYGLM